MLDRNAMAQLKGLRDELEAQNERVDATIKERSTATDSQ